MAIIYLNLSLKAQETKTKWHRWNLIKLKRFCTSRETTWKMKRQPIEWEKIFAKDDWLGVNIQNV